MSGTASDLAAVLADLAGSLPPAHVAAWARVLRDTPAPTTEAQARLIDAKPGYAIGGTAARLIGAWRAADPPPPGAAVALALEAAARVHAEYAARRTDVVVSGPGSNAASVRLTSSVVGEVIRDSRRSLLVVSFAAFGVADVVRELERAGARGVSIDLVLEGTEAEGGTLHGPVGASAAFEAIRRHGTFWAWPAAQSSEHRGLPCTPSSSLPTSGSHCWAARTSPTRRSRTTSNSASSSATPTSSAAWSATSAL